MIKILALYMATAHVAPMWFWVCACVCVHVCIWVCVCVYVCVFGLGGVDTVQQSALFGKQSHWDIQEHGGAFLASWL